MDLLAIQRAILDSTNILDDEVRLSYHCVRGEGRKSNRAIAKHGGFCLAFPMVSNDNGSKLCYRIWYQNVQNQQNAERIVKNLRRIDLPYFVQCRYIPDAIKVEGEILSGLKMDWIEGETLDKYLYNNCDRPEKLKKLASDFLTMCKDLNDNCIVHGDLSNANILVTSTGKLRLIDYDSLYLPRIERDIKQTTGGLPAFQHPQRIANPDRYMGENDDYFSQQVIYLSLLAIAKKPTLVDLIGEEELLFSGYDFQNDSNFVNSRGYKEIVKLKDQLINRLLDELCNAVSVSLSRVRSVCEIIESRQNNRHSEPPKTLYDNSGGLSEVIASLIASKQNVTPQKSFTPVSQTQPRKSLEKCCPVCGTPYRNPNSTYCYNCTGDPFLANKHDAFNPVVEKKERAKGKNSSLSSRKFNSSFDFTGCIWGVILLAIIAIVFFFFFV